jgi:hypothetical protein
VVKEKAVHLIGNYCIGIVDIQPDIVDPICAMVAMLFHNEKRYRNAILRRTSWCCASLIRRFQYAWQSPIESYQLLPLINDLFVRRNCTSLTHHLLYLIHQIFRSNVFFDSFDVGIILDLVNDPNDKIQDGALVCLYDLIVGNPLSIPCLLKRGIIEKVTECFVKNTYTVKMRCLNVIDALLDANWDCGLSSVEDLLKSEFMEAAIELIQVAQEQPVLFLIDIIVKCGVIAERHGCLGQYVDHMAQLDGERVFLELQERDNVVITESVQKAIVLFGW